MDLLQKCKEWLPQVEWDEEPPSKWHSVEYSVCSDLNGENK